MNKLASAEKQERAQEMKKQLMRMQMRIDQENPIVRRYSWTAADLQEDSTTPAANAESVQENIPLPEPDGFFRKILKLLGLI